MAERDFFSDAAKARAKEIVSHVESQTSAEIVITVRRTSGRYREADMLTGAVVALVVLCVLLFHPMPFDVRFMPIDVVLGFFVGWAVSTRSDALRRLLSTKGARRELVDRSAKAAFVDLGIAKTRGRTGLLVYVSMLERDVAFVADLAVEPVDLSASLEAARVAVRGGDFSAFGSAVESLGPKLGPVLPRSADDVNELPDEVQS